MNLAMIPNALTMLRIACVPLLIAVFYLPESAFSMGRDFWATAIFFVAGVTDWLDGWVARKYSLQSEFGAFLDPVADKLMVAAALVVLVRLHRADLFAAAMIISREIVISALREWMAKIGKGAVVAVAAIGKLKTTVQMLAIGFLLFSNLSFHGVSTHVIGYWLVWAAAILTLWSMLQYLSAAWSVIRPKQNAA